MNCAVSVVIPTRERPALVAEAVASALGQTVRDLEVIVVEDGSSAARPVVEGRDPRLTYIWQSQQGVSAARNTGILASSGEWVAFLDDDDLWRPTKLERQLQLAAQHPDVALVHTDFVRMASSGRLWAPQPIRQIPRSGSMLDALVFTQPGWGFMLTSSVLVRRTTVLACGGFNPAITLCEDYDLFLRLATKHSFGFVDEPLTIYRRHGTNVTVNELAAHAARVAVLERFLGTPGSGVTLSRRHRAHLGRTHLFCARMALLLGAEDQVRFHTRRAMRWNPLDPKVLVYALACIGARPGLRVLATLVRRREKAQP